MSTSGPLPVLGVSTDEIVSSLRAMPPAQGATLTSAVHCVLDTVAVAIAAADETVVQAVLRDALEEGGHSRSSIWGHAASLTPAQAARVNGTAAHALDFDDVSSLMEGHPSAPLLPAVLAMAESRGASGHQLLDAFVVGFEAEALVGRLVSPTHYADGFHSTATVGALGAAVGASRLLDLPHEAWLDALGIAASRAAGLKSMFGTMTKSLQVGAAAESGLRAALLAARGVDSDKDVLASSQGFRTTLSDESGVPERWGWRRSAVNDVLFKFHAACYLTHSAVEGGRALAREGLSPTEVSSVELLVPPGHLAVCNIESPRTPLEGKFSLRFTTAMALTGRTLGEEDFTSDNLGAPDVVSLMERTTVRARDTNTIRSSQVTVTLTDGTTRVVEVDVNRPTPEDELALREESLVAKFRSLVTPRLGAAATEELLLAVLDLPRSPDLTRLTQALTNAPAPPPTS